MCGFPQSAGVGDTVTGRRDGFARAPRRGTSTRGPAPSRGSGSSAYSNSSIASSRRVDHTPSSPRCSYRWSSRASGVPAQQQAFDAVEPLLRRPTPVAYHPFACPERVLAREVLVAFEAVDPPPPQLEPFHSDPAAYASGRESLRLQLVAATLLGVLAGGVHGPGHRRGCGCGRRIGDAGGREQVVDRGGEVVVHHFILPSASAAAVIGEKAIVRSPAPFRGA